VVFGSIFTTWPKLQGRWKTPPEISGLGSLISVLAIPYCTPVVLVHEMKLPKKSSWIFHNVELRLEEVDDKISSLNKLHPISCRCRLRDISSTSTGPMCTDACDGEAATIGTRKKDVRAHERIKVFLRKVKYVGH